jgi:hypothetical protein
MGCMVPHPFATSGDQPYLDYWAITDDPRHLGYKTLTRMFRLMEAIASCNKLSASMTCKHVSAALSSTWLQLIGGNGEPVELDRSNPGTLELVAPKDLGVGVASPGAMLRGALMPALCMTQSRSKPPVPSLGLGWPHRQRH